MGRLERLGLGAGILATLTLAACSALPAASDTPSHSAAPTARATLPPTPTLRPSPTAVPSPTTLVTPQPSATATAGGVVPAQPDARVHLAKERERDIETHEWEVTDRGGEWVGQGILNNNGKRQKSSVQYYSTSPVDMYEWSFAVVIQNTGSAPDRFAISASGPDPAPEVCYEGDKCYSWTIQFFADEEDVTKAVESGSFTTPPLNPGEESNMLVVITGNNYGDVERLVTAASVADSSLVDAVKVLVEELTCAC